jgi:hypothetical protein
MLKHHKAEWRFELVPLYRIPFDRSANEVFPMGQLNGHYIHADTPEEAQAELGPPGHGKAWRLDTRQAPWQPALNRK